MQSAETVLDILREITGEPGAGKPARRVREGDAGKGPKGTSPASYLALWDEDFGPGFIKICAYFPYPIKICLLTELPGESSQLRGQVGVLTGTVPTRDRFRGAGPGPAGVGGSTVGCAAGRRGPVRAVSAA